jgi:two-component SAPR family response regulator
MLINYPFDIISGNLPSNAAVLVIDDEFLSVFICEQFIKRIVKDPEISSCSNGKHAIDLLLEIKNQDIGLLPDYIFLDIAMPVMNAWEFLEKYNDLNIDPSGKCKIYILTSSLYQSDIRKSASFTMITDYIIKPLDAEKMRNVFIGAN